MSDVFLDDAVDELRLVLDSLQLVGCFLTDADGHGHVAVCCRTATTFTIAAPVLSEKLKAFSLIKNLNEFLLINCAS